jgi:hypothetical protein
MKLQKNRMIDVKELKIQIEILNLLYKRKIVYSVKAETTFIKKKMEKN